MIKAGLPTMNGKRSNGNVDAVPTQATCKCKREHGNWSSCPRHSPVNYADYMARHATDSI